ncbi:MAG: hypothetical protein HYV19_13510 [Gemmatimonadetes bacterium]|nr:hypothetical protein [Gemmatimonadota bacterium]
MTKRHATDHFRRLHGARGDLVDSQVPAPTAIAAAGGSDGRAARDLLFLRASPSLEDRR